MIDTKFYFLFTFFILILLSPLISQEGQLIHIVDMMNERQVPFATVSNPAKSQGIYANELGVFDLANKEISELDSLMISAIGYVDQLVLVKDLKGKDTISLDISDITLREVVVTASELDDEESDGYYLGVLQKKNDGGLRRGESTPYGSEYAIRMEKKKLSDEIAQIYIYLNAFKGNAAPFRIKIYDDHEGLPSKLLHSMIVKPKRKLKKWKPIPLSNKIVTKNHKVFYVAFEWLETNEKKYTSTVKYRRDGKRYERTYFGQYLGSVQDPNQHIGFFIKGTLNDKWYNSNEITNIKTGAPMRLPPIMLKVRMTNH